MGKSRRQLLFLPVSLSTYPMLPLHLDYAKELGGYMEQNWFVLLWLTGGGEAAGLY